MKIGKGTGSSGIEKFGAVQFMLFWCVWAAFGIFAFFQIGQWGHDYDRKMSLVAAGKVPAQRLYVASIYRGQEEGGWNIGLSTDVQKRPPAILDVYGRMKELRGLAIGSEVTAYRIDGKWFVPRFFTGGFNWGKWVFLCFGLIPPLIAGIAMRLVSARRLKTAVASTTPVPWHSDAR